MASMLIGQLPPSVAATADTYVKNVFGGQGDVSGIASPTHLRSAQPVQVQQYRKVLRMVDTMKVSLSKPKF
jgi:hypothetical protein